MNSFKKLLSVFVGFIIVMAIFCVPAPVSPVGESEAVVPIILIGLAALGVGAGVGWLLNDIFHTANTASSPNLAAAEEAINHAAWVDQLAEWDRQYQMFADDDVNTRQLFNNTYLSCVRAAENEVSSVIASPTWADALANMTTFEKFNITARSIIFNKLSQVAMVDVDIMKELTIVDGFSYADTEGVFDGFELLDNDYNGSYTGSYIISYAYAPPSKSFKVDNVTYTGNAATGTIYNFTSYNSVTGAPVVHWLSDIDEGVYVACMRPDYNALEDHTHTYGTMDCIDMIVLTEMYDVRDTGSPSNYVPIDWNITHLLPSNVQLYYLTFHLDLGIQPLNHVNGHVLFKLNINGVDVSSSSWYSFYNDVPQNVQVNLTDGTNTTIENVHLIADFYSDYPTQAALNVRVIHAGYSNFNTTASYVRLDNVNNMSINYTTQSNLSLASALSHRSAALGLYTYWQPALDAIYTAMYNAAYAQYMAYKNLGYDAPSEIPTDAIVPYPDFAMSNLEALKGVNETEMMAIYYSMLAQFNTTAVVNSNMSSAAFNITDDFADIMLNGSLVRGNTTIFNGTVWAVVLSSAMTFSAGNSTNLTGSVMFFSPSAGLIYMAQAGDVFTPSAIVADGQAVDNMTLESTTLKNYVTSSYGLDLDSGTQQQTIGWIFDDLAFSSNTILILLAGFTVGGLLLLSKKTRILGILILLVVAGAFAYFYILPLLQPFMDWINTLGAIR